MYEVTLSGRPAMTLRGAPSPTAASMPSFSSPSELASLQSKSAANRRSASASAQQQQESRSQQSPAASSTSPSPSQHQSGSNKAHATAQPSHFPLDSNSAHATAEASVSGLGSMEAGTELQRRERQAGERHPERRHELKVQLKRLLPEDVGGSLAVLPTLTQRLQSTYWSNEKLLFWGAVAAFR